MIVAKSTSLGNLMYLAFTTGIWFWKITPKKINIKISFLLIQLLNEL